ncbi:orotidine-5'-phosphate decarboxylase [Natronoglycomyces albus]|uniref:Orotidine-5'-phosphate decarboxylase n=1 Tax=Natronoglycomyces albus TaxID=2811108 RepID=A0A895XNC3_9ACTN|nr:orotidine-5'-phosphate decarboxylase [Natronoglycomyces albus]QSB06617.1 orotidine-5'-phosphate decarboxylase [Natronoglycomyces albus]
MNDQHNFGLRVQSAIEQRGRLCVGVDPHASLLAAWGLNDDLASATRFSYRLVDAVAQHVGFIKPQSAFFERFGWRGLALLEKVVERSRSAGALVILDVKRGDIGSTMRAYAEAYLPKGAPCEVDAITVSPFLGVGSLQPAVDIATEHGKGLFTLALTSNPEGRSVQSAVGADGRTVSQSVIDAAGLINAAYDPIGPLGVVVGATVGAEKSEVAAKERESKDEIAHTQQQTSESGHDLSKLRGPVLVPGMGAQGGQPEDLKRVLGPALKWSIPTYSRQIAQAGPSLAGIQSAVKDLQAAYRVTTRL